ncbi:putative coniferyl aldehyde dehydrogenase [Chitiniphilus shinanonensis]|uniref:Aldehyde dehydrogenase n=1 Tax=Chitiniphilus shinanonensis TaxID=553088 RepID=A0ABQ6BPH7_9NEIS|nr:aldehyde dehydrogenase family protein [Chitiniphilus shinanonensis]GLS03080.1 putative coniferyl aldehyde dehydrogenase [Chitiniphilus shinanonensis]
MATLEALWRAQRAACLEHGASTGQQRREALARLAQAVRDDQELLVAAVAHDFGCRPAEETRLLELLPLLDAIRHARRHLRRWMRPRRAATNWQFLPSKARVLYQPLGVVGIIGAWNYPILLTLSPLVDALAAGNRVMLKPSELAPATAAALAALIARTFPPEQVTVVQGDAEVAAAFSALPFDHLLFTGSSRVARQVLHAAADRLTPVTLELGGKSPALVHASFALDQAADRICTAKFWNAGQTCVAPDHVWVPTALLPLFAECAVTAIRRRWPQGVDQADYTHLINNAAATRQRELLDDALAHGARALWPVGEWGEGRALPPVLLLGCTTGMRVMQEEIFGPILPLCGYDELDQALTQLAAPPHPLALYYFDRDRTRVEAVLARTRSGGVTVNDCLFHLAQHDLPFGGVGASGMGAYHGEAGFRRFSHARAVLWQSEATARLLGLFKPPYRRLGRRLVDWLLR